MPKFASPINLQSNELQNAVIQNLSSAPSNAKEGQIYYDTTLECLMIFNGNSWEMAGSGGSGSDVKDYTFATGETNGTFTVTPTDTNIPQEVAIAGLKESAYREVDTEIGDTESNNVPTSNAVKTFVQNTISAIDGMDYKGTLGADGDVATLPETDMQNGDTYKVVTKGEYAGQNAYIGDMFIYNEKSSAWDYIPSANDINRLETINPELTSSGGVCNWIINHNLGTRFVNANVYETATGEMIICDVIVNSTSQIEIRIASDETIAEGTFTIAIIG